MVSRSNLVIRKSSIGSFADQLGEPGNLLALATGIELGNYSGEYAWTVGNGCAGEFHSTRTTQQKAHNIVARARAIGADDRNIQGVIRLVLEARSA